jgi:molybdopterin molybdotransferase
VLTVEAGRTLRAGENVVARGAEARAGDSLLPVGHVMGAAEIAVAASCGCAELEVFARPKVAIVATGDELVEVPASSAPTQVSESRPGAPTVLSDGEIYNSNSYALAALVRGEGGLAGRLAIARDTREDLWERVAQGSMWDLLLLSGGVSMGKHDLVEEMLAEFDAEFFFTGAMIQPGRPVVFGRLPKRGGTAHPKDGPWSGEWTYFFGLPGNPVSTQVCFHLFVAPLLRALAGWSSVAPEFVEARLAEDVRGGAKVTRFLPAEMVSAWDGVTVRVVGWQGSGDVAANARGNCYCVLPAGVEAFAKGETVRVLLR